MSNDEQFRHDRLPSPRSIRLLHLQPSADFSAQLEVNLTIADLDSIGVAGSTSIPSYEALSYVWGCAIGTNPIKCNGKLLLVTPNCDEALRYLRAEKLERTLWVDAICIDQEKNQESTMERNGQVALMGEIYAKATHTHCWLGEGTAFTNEVVRHLEKIGTCPSKRGLNKLLLYDEQLRKNDLLDEETCLIHIFCHPWHSRIWTVQEVAFSRDCHILCGKASIPWDKYFAAAKFLIFDEFIEQLDQTAHKSFVSIDMRNTIRDFIMTQELHDGDEDEDEQDHRNVFLTSCLTDVNQLKATEPKDRVYGLYALYSALNIALPTVDYDKSLAQVYEEAAVSMIVWSASLRVLGDACSNNKDPSLPSWVPDWHDEDVRFYTPSDDATRGSRVANPNPEGLTPTPGKLHVRGKVVGEVVEWTGPRLSLLEFPAAADADGLPILVGEHVGFTEEPETLRLLVRRIRFFRELLRLLEAHPEVRIDGGAEESLYYKIVTLGTESLDQDAFDIWLDILKYSTAAAPAYDLSAGAALAERWRSQDKANAAHWTPEVLACAAIAAALLSNSIGSKEADFAEASAAVLDLISRISGNLNDRAIVVVRDDVHRRKCVASTFHAVRPGDAIVLLEGSGFPAALRRKRSHWRFVGPAYVDGIMDGEAWSVGGDRADDDLREFVLV